MHDYDFLPLRSLSDCSRAPSARSVSPLPDTYLVIATDDGVDALDEELAADGRGRRPYPRFPLLEVTCSPPDAEGLAGDPRVTLVLPALGSLASRRTLAKGFAVLSALAEAQNRQTGAQLYGGRRAGDPIGYPILTVEDGRPMVDFDDALDLPAPGALLPVVNFSVGPTSATHPFLANDIVNIATYLASRSMVVVAAAGNCGAIGDGSMSAWAQAPWVLAVGATSDEEGTTLADFSSRGRPGVEGSGPDLVAYGRSDVAPHPMGTSFAAPRVTALARLITAAMAQLGRGLRVARGAEDHGVPLVGSAILDDFGDELTDHGVEYLPLIALPLVGVDKDVVGRYIESTPQGVDVRITPDWLRSFLLDCATPMGGYAAHEVGRGFIDVDRVIGALSRVTFADLDRWFGTPSPTGHPAAQLRPFVADGLAMLDGLVRRSGPSVRYDYRTGRTVMVPPLRERVERPPNSRRDGRAASLDP